MPSWDIVLGGAAFGRLFGTPRSGSALRCIHLHRSRNVELATVVQAAVMWNAVWLPAEQSPVLPVDRHWDLSKGPANPDWSYTMFQW